MAEITNLDSILQPGEIMRTKVAVDETNVESFVERMQEQGVNQPIAIKEKTLTKKGVPIPEKALLTLDEAAQYTGIGQNKLREISNEDDCPFVLWNGSKRMFKREKLVSFLYSVFSI